MAAEEQEALLHSLTEDLTVTFPELLVAKSETAHLVCLPVYSLNCSCTNTGTGRIDRVEVGRRRFGKFSLPGGDHADVYAPCGADDLPGR